MRLPSASSPKSSDAFIKSTGVSDVLGLDDSTLIKPSSSVNESSIWVKHPSSRKSKLFDSFPTQFPIAFIEEDDAEGEIYDDEADEGEIDNEENDNIYEREINNY